MFAFGTASPSPSEMRQVPISPSSEELAGSSDPYVKFKQGARLLFKSSTIFRNLNPSWEEEFSLLVDEVSNPIDVEVRRFQSLCVLCWPGTDRVPVSIPHPPVPSHIR